LIPTLSIIFYEGTERFESEKLKGQSSEQAMETYISRIEELKSKAG